MTPKDLEGNLVSIRFTQDTPLRCKNTNQPIFSFKKGERCNALFICYLPRLAGATKFGYFPRIPHKFLVVTPKGIGTFLLVQDDISKIFRK